jgi:glycosyltransferase involved in cell wall biosynthesis
LSAQSLDLSVVIPCYNEEIVLEESIRELVTLLNHTIFSYEIILVEDKSRDRTRQIAERLINEYDRIKLICHEKNEGRGKAVTDGILASSGEIVGFIDIDLEIAIHNIIPLIIKIKEGYQVATGRRFYRISWNQRWITSRIYSWLVKSLLRVDIKDTETGCKFFNREAILPILKKTKDPHWFWDTEIMVLAYCGGLKMVEYNVLFVRRPEVPSTVRLIRDSFNSFYKLLQFRKVVRDSFKSRE